MILILGDGLLGSELAKQTGWDFVSRKKDNFNLETSDIESFLTKEAHGVIFYKPYDVIVNCIAHTNTYSSERELHWNTNVIGLHRLVTVCNKLSIKLVHISTDYLYANSDPNAIEKSTPPVHSNNWYGYTKLVGDAVVQLLSTDYLLIRATHKPKPFRYDSALTTQRGNFDYVDVIAEKIIQLIRKEAHGIYNVGTEVKTMYDLALQTNPNVKPVTKISCPIPEDTTMNLGKMKKLLG